jgi:light-harvesting protein B-800-850 alpha chain
MNNGRLWCVVSPTVGIPLFLGAVALTSLTVHNAVLSNTTWYKDFYSGKAISDFKAAEVAKPASLTSAPSDFTINVTPVAGASNGAAAFTVTVTPKSPTAAKAELTMATTAK